MGAEAWAGLPSELAGWPAWTPGEAQLADLELLTIGAFEPLQGFMTSADLAAMAERGTLADGTPWPIPVTLEVPEDAVPAGASHLVLQDQEGTPLAVLQITEQLPIRGYSYGEQALSGWRLAGPVTPLREPEHGPFRRLRRRQAEVRADLAKQGDGPVLAAVTRGALHRRQIGQLRHLADQMKARLLLLPLVARPGRRGRPAGRAGAGRAGRHPEPARGHHGGPGAVAAPGGRPQRRAARPRRGGRRVRGDAPAGRPVRRARRHAHRSPGNSKNGPLQLPGLPIPIISAGDWAYDPRSEVWRPLSLIEPGAERSELTHDELTALLDRGESLPSWYTPEAVAHELRLARPPRDQRGLVIFFTGLSGSGKSTVARDLRDALSERGDRTVIAARRGPGAPPAVRRADLLPRRPGPEHRPHRLRGGRDRPARRHRHLRARSPRTRRPGRGSGRWPPWPATSCSSTCRRRWRCARRGTARACTRRPGPA